MLTHLILQFKCLILTRITKTKPKKMIINKIEQRTIFKNTKPKKKTETKKNEEKTNN